MSWAVSCTLVAELGLNTIRGPNPCEVRNWQDSPLNVGFQRKKEREAFTEAYDG